MSSAALVEWQGPRQARIDELITAHARVGGVGSGRRWRTQQLNWSLVLRVAAEFQGFSRALHDEAAVYFIQEVGGLNGDLQAVLYNVVARDRLLDRGNAHPGSLGADFGRFGLDVWPTLTKRYSAASGWNEGLEQLNRARNAIAHDNTATISQLAVEGWPLSQLATVKRFRRSADRLAVGMDTVLAEHLQRLLGGPRPW